MALVDRIEAQDLEKDVAHRAARCTYSLVPTPDEGLLFQLDTYGSKLRKMKDKKSQSVRFTKKALEELVHILKKHRLGGL